MEHRIQVSLRARPTAETDGTEWVMLDRTQVVCTRTSESFSFGSRGASTPR